MNPELGGKGGRGDSSKTTVAYGFFYHITERVNHWDAIIIIIIFIITLTAHRTGRNKTTKETRGRGEREKARG
jgi:hypothetical protein